jgi:hypothetical protein
MEARPSPLQKNAKISEINMEINELHKEFSFPARVKFPLLARPVLTGWSLAGPVGEL